MPTVRLVIGGWFDRLSPDARAIAALGAAVMVGITATLAGIRVQGLPAQVAANSAQIATNTAAINRMEHSDSAIIHKLEQTQCLLTLPETTRVRLADSPVLLQRECP